MYNDSLRRILLVLLILCSTFFLSSSQGKNFSVNRTVPSWIIKVDPSGGKPKSKDIIDGYYLSLMEYQQHAELQEEYTHIIRQIVSDAGVQNASQISVTYDPSYQKLIFNKVIIWRDNKPYDQLNATKFKVLQNEKDLSKFIYSGTYDAYMLLDDIRKGDRIEYAFTLKGYNPIFGKKYASSIYTESSTSIGHSYMNLMVSKTRDLKFKSFNSANAARVSDKDGLKLYEWEGRLTKTYRSADYEPSWYNPFKYVQISEYQDWNEIVNWGLRVNSYEGLKTPLVDQKVKELMAKAKNDTAKYIVLATRFAQDEIRYMGIEMGQYSQRPNSPEKVFRQRYGDCKDKSLLLTYLLNKANVSAYMAYVDTYAGKKTDEFLPSPDLFNHVVVVVEYHNNKTWIDPTISYQRGTFDNIYFPNYGKALVLKPGVGSPEDVISIATGKLIANLNFTIADTTSNKETKLIINSTYTDNYADDIRSLIADEGDDGIEKSFLEYIKKYYPDIENEGNIKIKDNEETNTIDITESYVIKNMWQEDEKNTGLRYTYFYGDMIDHTLREIAIKNRTEPLALKYPVNIEQKVFINLPYVADISDESEVVETDNNYFEFNSFHKGNQIRLNYVYRTLTDHVDENGLKQYVKDTKKISDMLAYRINWGGDTATYNLNPYLIMLVILTMVVSAFYFIRIHQQQYEFDLDRINAARPIGGWLVMVAITLIISPFSLIASAFKSEIFNMTVWDAAEKLNTMQQFTVHGFFVVTAVGFAIQLTWVFLLLVLFFNRREVFPQQFIRYMIFYAALTIFDAAGGVFISAITHVTMPNGAELAKALIRIIVMGLWVAYFKKSERVRETFVFTYPDHLWKTAWMEQTNQLINKKQDTIHQSPVATDEDLKNNNNENV